MIVSSFRAITLLLIVSLCTADLPSCARAKCVHCAVDFINRMCPTACSGCNSQSNVGTIQQPQQQQQPRVPQPPSVYGNQQQAQQFQVPQQSQQSLQPQQPQQQPQQPNPLVNLPFQPQAQPLQFAAPVYQQNPLPYPQSQAQSPVIETATLAPLVEPPKVSNFDPTLSQQPADLAQPLPEYQAGQFSQQSSYGGIQQQAQPQPLGYGTQVNQMFAPQNVFAQPAQPAQGLFGATNPQQNAALLNPFQPFLQQTNAVLDPFNLFNLNGNLNNPNPLAINQQGTSTAQVQQQYGQVQHQGNYNLYPQNQQQQIGQSQQIQPQQQYGQQTNYQQQQYQQYNNQQPQQLQQSYNQQSQQSQQSQSQQPQYSQNQYYQQPNQQGNHQPVQALSANPQQQRQSVISGQSNKPQQAPAPATSVDSRPVNFEKYVDPGKGTPLAPPPASTCPRQPGWQPCITKEIANDRFRTCCSRLGEGCAPLCNYDATLATMQLAVLTGRCPLGKVGDVMICASGYQDATQCCEAYGVFEPGYEHCRPYCNPSAGLPQGGLLTEKYKCLVKLQNIQQCFFVSQKP